MGITAGQLADRYPVLYHMAWKDSWPSICRQGLLSTAELLNRFEISDPLRTDLLTKQRRDPVEISHPILGIATLRDQKPASAKNLARCLTDCKPKSWYLTLNERVFFWLCRDRLIRMMSAGEYVGKTHTILEIETAKLVSQYVDKIELAHMNTGNTRPYPHPRGRSTFRKMEQYSYLQRQRLDDYSAVVELTVLGGVPDIRDFVLKVEHATFRDRKYRVVEPLFSR